MQVLRLICLAILSGCPAYGAILLRVTKTVDRPTASISQQEVFNYSLSYSNSSLGQDANGGIIEDTLDPKLEFVALSQSAHVDTAVYTPATRKVRFTFKSPLPAGAVGTLGITCRLRTTVTNGAIIGNTATAWGVNSDLMTSNSVSISGHSAAAAPSGCLSSGLVPELEFTTYNLDVRIGQSFNIRNYVKYKDSNAQVDWTKVYFTYTGAGANSPTTPADWNLAKFNTGTMVTATAADANAPGNSGDGQFRIYMVRLGSNTYDDHMEMRVSNDSSNDINEAKANLPGTLSTAYTFDHRIVIQKVGLYGNPAQNGGYVGYNLFHHNTYPTGHALTNYQITDDLPPGVRLEYVGSDAFVDTANVSLFFKSNLNASWRPFNAPSGTPPNTYQTVSPRVFFWASQLGLPTTEYVTSLQFRYTGMKGGCGFGPSGAKEPIQIVGRVVPGRTAAPGAPITGCSGVAATSATTATNCYTTTVEAQRPRVHAYMTQLTGDWPPYERGEQFTTAIVVANEDISTSSIINPEVAFLTPPDIEYLGMKQIVGDAWTAAGSPQPVVEVTNNFYEPGRTLVRILWGPTNPFTIPPSPMQWQNTFIEANFRVRETTPNSIATIDGFARLSISREISTEYSNSCGSQVYQNYNVIARNSLRPTAEIGGRIAAQSYTGTASTSLATQLAGWPAADNALQIGQGVVFGDPLTVTNGSVYAPTWTAINNRTINAAGGIYNWGGPDFTSLFSGLQLVSGLYTAMSANSTVAMPSGVGTATLNVGSNLGAANVAVFQVDGNTLLNNSNVTSIDLNLNGKTPNAILIRCTGANVTHSSATFTSNMTAVGYRPKILWHFPNATGVTLNRTLYGSILAPDATVVVNEILEGSVYANNVENSAKINLPVFSGNLCPGTTATQTVVESGIPFLSWREPDKWDWNKNGDTTELTGMMQRGVQVLTNGGVPALTARMTVIGELDTVPKVAPDTALTTPSGKADYTLKFTNDAGVALKNLTVINILPHLGDKGVVDLASRGSTFSPYLAAPISAPNATVFYSLAGNPCRDELTPGIPVGCSPPNWTNVPPGDLSTVRALKLEFGATAILPSQSMEISWPMRVPINAPTASTDVAWNSFGFRVQRADTLEMLLPSEPRMTGVKVQPPLPPFYGDKVWLDTDEDGIQDGAEVGLNGIRVDLYRDNGDNVRDTFTDTFVKFTTTAGGGLYRFANIGPGNYYAAVQVPTTFGVTVMNQGGDDAMDSDGEATQIGSGRVALMSLTDLVTGESDLTWDQGLVDRTSTPAVWAARPMENGSVYIGGRFSAIAGTPRKNIARITASGSLDAGFDPGTGCNQEVLSVATMGNGNVVVGGRFTQYSGLPAAGLLLLQPNGALAASMLMPDTPDVRWVGTAGSQIYVAGKFFKINGTDRDCIARISSDGSLDSSFNASNGANDAINDAAILPDGSVIAVGRFTSYGGVARAGVVKINADGTLNTAFDIGSGANNEVHSVKALTDGRLIVSGSFTQFNGVLARGSMRLEPTGAVDATLQMHDLSVNSINTLD